MEVWRRKMRSALDAAPTASIDLNGVALKVIWLVVLKIIDDPSREFRCSRERLGHEDFHVYKLYNTTTPKVTPAMLQMTYVRINYLTSVQNTMLHYHCKNIMKL